MPGPRVAFLNKNGRLDADGGMALRRVVEAAGILPGSAFSIRANGRRRSEVGERRTVASERARRIALRVEADRPRTPSSRPYDRNLNRPPGTVVLIGST